MGLSRTEEKAIRKLLLEGVECNRIAEITDIDHCIIRETRDYLEIVNSMPEKLNIKIRHLLSAGQSHGVIETRLLVPKKNIRALLRSDKFHGLTTSKIKTCKQCGAIIISPVECPPPKRKRFYSSQTTQVDVNTLCGIMTDLLQLNDLQLITNPLFHHIARRAERIYDRVNKKNTQKADTPD